MMLILQLKKRIEILEAKVQEQDQKINDLLNKFVLQSTLPTLATPKEKKQPFKKPTVQEVYDYACPPLRHEDALVFSEKFHAHYEANGWKVVVGNECALAFCTINPLCSCKRLRRCVSQHRSRIFHF